MQNLKLKKLTNSEKFTFTMNFIYLLNSHLRLRRQTKSRSFRILYSDEFSDVSILHMPRRINKKKLPI